MIEEVEQLAAGVSALLDRNPWAMSDRELVEVLTAVSAVADRIDVMRAGLVREIDARGLYTTDGSSSVAIWLRDRMRVSVHTGRQLAVLARLLSDRPALRDAVAA